MGRGKKRKRTKLGVARTTAPTQLHASVPRIIFSGAISCVCCKLSVLSPPYLEKKRPPSQLPPLACFPPIHLPTHPASLPLCLRACIPHIHSTLPPSLPHSIPSSIPSDSLSSLPPQHQPPLLLSLPLRFLKQKCPPFLPCRGRGLPCINPG